LEYASGETVRVGDRVRLGEDENGIVVCVFDTDEFSDEFAVEYKETFKTGALVKFPKLGLIHYPDKIEPDLLLLSRAGTLKPEL
jgi:hypothetical protein